MQPPYPPPADGQQQPQGQYPPQMSYGYGHPGMPMPGMMPPGFPPQPGMPGMPMYPPGMMPPGMMPPGMMPGQFPPGTMQPMYPPGSMPGVPPQGMMPPQGVPPQGVPPQGVPPQGMPPGQYPPGMMPGYAPAPGMQPQPGQYAPLPGVAPAMPQALTPAAAEDAARQLYSAFRGAGTNDTEVIRILTAHNKRQLGDISAAYFQRFGKTLEAALRSELSGSYLNLAVAIIKQPYRMEASLIKKALEDKSDPDVDCIGEILGTRTSAEIQLIAQMYNSDTSPTKKKKKKAKSRNFVNEIVAIQSVNKDMGNWFGALLRNVRPTGPAEQATVERDARDLIAAAKGLGTDEAIFFDILARRSYAHLAKVSEELSKQRKKDLVKLIESEFSRGTERALVATAMMAKSPAHAQAYILYRSMKGAGTADARLIRTIAYIYDNPLREATKRAYREMYGKDLVREVASETSFNYKKLATGLLEFKGTDLPQ